MGSIGLPVLTDVPPRVSVKSKAPWRFADRAVSPALSIRVLAAAALVVVGFALAPGRRWRVGGDYVHVQTMDQSHEDAPAQPQPPCHGPGCSKAPAAPLVPLTAPVLTSSETATNRPSFWNPCADDRPGRRWAGGRHSRRSYRSTHLLDFHPPVPADLLARNQPPVTPPLRGGSRLDPPNPRVRSMDTLSPSPPPPAAPRRDRPVTSRPSAPKLRVLLCRRVRPVRGPRGDRGLPVGRHGVQLRRVPTELHNAVQPLGVPGPLGRRRARHGARSSRSAFIHWLTARKRPNRVAVRLGIARVPRRPRWSA